MIKSIHFLAFALIASISQTTFAGVISLPPFAGVFTETWESFPTTEKGAWLDNPAEIMAGAATISQRRMAVFDSSSPIGLGESGPAHPSDGNKAMVAVDLATTATIFFVDPVVRFGAYWGAQTANQDPSIGDPAFINVGFYDTFNGLINTQVFEYTRSQYGDGMLEWHGWSSTIPIKRITYSEDTPVVDGLQADPVPEPTAIGLLILAAACLRRTQPNHSNRA